MVDCKGKEINPGDVLMYTTTRRERMVYADGTGELYILTGEGSYVARHFLHENDLSCLEVVGHVDWYDDFLAKNGISS